MTRAEMTDENMIKTNDFLVALADKNNERAFAIINQNNGVSTYQEAMIRYQSYETKALILFNAKDYSLAAFYKKVANHFKEFAHNLSEVVIHI